jgi:hypothetical protein
MRLAETRRSDFLKDRNIMIELDYKKILYKIRPTNRNLWSVSMAVLFFGVIWVVSLFELFGVKSESLPIISGLFTALFTGRFAEAISVRKKIDHAIKSKNAT